MKFTLTEWEIILHRLEASDAIAEVMLDDDEIPAQPWDSIIESVELLIKDGPKFNRRVSTFEFWILQEACNGSTWFAGCNAAVDAGDMNKDQLKRYSNAADVLESMLNVSIPRA